jgi:tripartite-type tricarboxylate transporter receptor subunit TctC
MNARMYSLLACVLLSLVFSSHVAAQTAPATYPTKPIRIVVPFTPGGPADMIARPIAQGLTESWGQQVISDNRPGGSGNIGAELAAKSAPDGYTLLLATPGIIAVNPSLYSKIQFDTLRDFAGVTNAATTASIMVVPPSLPVQSVKDLIRIARERPGQLSYATSGNGSASHLGTEMFKSIAHVDIVHVPYKGAAPGVTDLMGGHVQLMIIGMPVALPHVRSGKLKSLGVASLKRSLAAPELATLNESGLPGFEVLNWMGLVFPAKTQRGIVSKLSAEIRLILHKPEMKERLLAQGFEAVGNTPDEFDAYIRSEIAKWSKVVKQAGIKPD